MSVRVLVVDDSAFMRQMIGRLLTEAPLFEVVGSARDGVEAVEMAVRLRPDVITLDVEMPRLDGLGALRQLMKACPTPVVMVSSLTRAHAEPTIRALIAGAVDFVTKPENPLDLARVGEELRAKVLAASRVRLGSPARCLPLSARRPPGAHRERLVVIGCSTGGPQALRALVPALPSWLPAPVLVVQHMPPGFTQPLAERLDRESSLAVREAADGDRLHPGQVLVAPGGWHCLVHADGTVRLDGGPARHGVRPAVDATLETVARSWGDRAVVAILTGMGSDGTDGAKLVHKAGGFILAEDERSCVVYGMPRSVVEAGCAHRVVPLEAMADAIVEAVVRPSGRGVADGR